LTRNDPTYVWFVGPRPISTKGISNARLVAGFKSILWGYGLLLVSFVLLYRILFPEHPIHSSVIQDLSDTTHMFGSYAEGVLMLTFYFAVALLGVWSLFWLGRAAGVAVWIAGIPAGIHFYKTGELYVFTSQALPESSVLMTFMYALTAIAAGSLVISYAVAYRRGHVSSKGLAALLAIAVALGVCAFVFRDFIPTRKTWLVALWLCLPIIPFATLPLTIDWQRHR
jgi:hypothetical protein